MNRQSIQFILHDLTCNGWLLSQFHPAVERCLYRTSLFTVSGLKAGAQTAQYSHSSSDGFE